MSESDDENQYFSPVDRPSDSPSTKRTPSHDPITPRKKHIKQVAPVLPKHHLIPSDTSPHKIARTALHSATIPDALPCREDEYSQIFWTLHSAISSATGCCIYISGTPGTGKTATVREAIAQLQLRVQDEELTDFSFLEINGMKLTNPHSAYEILYHEISGGKRATAANSMELLETEFKSENPNRMATVVLMDELDQLVTKNQGVMYNFFNWPTFIHSKLIVIAVANTMDLPERMLSNKISSRLGLTRMQFPGYTHQQLVEIIETRLKQYESQNLMEKDSIEFAARKIAGVSGDARRALDICRRSVELAEEEFTPVSIAQIQKAIQESTNSPLTAYIRSLPFVSKVFLCALLARVRRSGVIEHSLGDIMEESNRLISMENNSEHLKSVLYAKKVRIMGFQNAVYELTESGVLIQQVMKGERSANVRLNITEDEIKGVLKKDKEVEGML